ncbi:MAG TPA: ricin-type beta-trefoil lectin domain protein, partial [Streptosporangiaceae bacterium]
MRRWRVAAAATVSCGVLAVGMFAAFNLTAQAATNACTWTPPSGTSTVAPTCAVTDYTMVDPLAVTLAVTTTPGGDTVNLNWEMFCTDANNATTGTVPGSGSVAIPSGTGSQTASYTITNANLPLTEAASCELTTASATESLAASSTGAAAPSLTALGLTISYTEQAAPTPSSTASPTPSASTSSAAPKKYNNQVHGFDGTCLDDKGNKSAKRSAVILWQCDNADQAQGWTYSGSELKIHGMCLNAKGNGKSGSRL